MRRMSRCLVLALALLLLGYGVTSAQGAPGLTDRPLWLRQAVVSPDGSRIAFTYMGTLYVVPVSGGEARPLTLGEGYVGALRWSPDSKRIAYEADTYGNFDIFTISAQGGESLRVTSHSSSEGLLSYNAKGDSLYIRASYMPESQSGNVLLGWNRPTYRVAADGTGDPTVFLVHPAADMNVQPGGKLILFEDEKGNEDPLRKHHVSSISRDIWQYDPAAGKVRQLIDRAGEDRSPRITKDGQSFYFLSERDGGSYNVYKAPVATPAEARPVTSFSKHPVRFLSVADDGLLCYTFDGEIYTQRGDAAQPERLNVQIAIRPTERAEVKSNLSRGIMSAAISPDGTEIAYVVRGEVYVTSIKHGHTVRITDTPTQERDVSYASDGRSIVYAGERDGSWNLYIARIARSDEKSFAAATEIKEELLLKNGKANFQPLFSPDGKEVAFLEDRTKLKVINVASKAVRQITDGRQNYSYSDGDIPFSWSPDGKWLTLVFNDKLSWSDGDIGIVSAKGGEPVHNITNTGYDETSPRFVMNGEMLIWLSDREGLRQHASWGAQLDVYGFLVNKEAYDKFTRTEFEDAIAPDDKKDEEADSKSKDKKSSKKDKDKKEEKSKSVEIDFTNIEDRIMRLTIHSSDLSDAVVTPDGKYLYYLTSFEEGFNLWKENLKKGTTEQILSLDLGYAALSLDKKGENMLIASNSSLIKVSLSSDKKENAKINAPFTHRPSLEREYMFNHAWQQVVDKFYKTDLHGVDWTGYRDAYKKFLPHITNNYDFADMLSELLGELNASHTGSGYRPRGGTGSAQTADLGLFFDPTYKGKGLKVVEVLRGGPCDRAEIKIKPGAILSRIDGEEVTGLTSLNRLLDRKVGARVRIELGGQSVVVKPTSQGMIRELLYERWIEQRRREVDSLSGGRLGYVHIRAMNGASYRTVYADLKGRFNQKEGIVIDTRYNGGGRLHENVEVLFSGHRYLNQVPREQMVGSQPQFRWTKPSIMLMGESNYSNAHGTPWVYKNRGIGRLVGMPVPGTMTSVWWETQIDNSLYFGIPIVGYVDSTGSYLENQQLEPDVRAQLDYQRLRGGHDSQIEAAVRELLKDVDAFNARSPWGPIDKKYIK